jgi:hypothetical protein
MRSEQRRQVVQNQYVDSQVWKCERSPTGAHHDMVQSFPQSDQHTAHVIGRCKYCGRERQYPQVVEVSKVDEFGNAATSKLAV